PPGERAHVALLQPGADQEQPEHGGDAHRHEEQRRDVQNPGQMVIIDHSKLYQTPASGNDPWRVGRTTTGKWAKACAHRHASMKAWRQFESNRPRGRRESTRRATKNRGRMGRGFAPDKVGNRV